MIKLSFPRLRRAELFATRVPSLVDVPRPPRQSLCTSCVYAHVVRGYEPCEVLIVCGYAFPPREVPFPVRECTDYKPKRECNGVEIASEGAVSFPPLDNWAADFRAVAATHPPVPCTSELTARDGKDGEQSE